MYSRSRYRSIVHDFYSQSFDENAVLSCAIYDLIIRDHIANNQFTYNEVQTMIDDLCMAWIVYSMLKTTGYVYQYYVVS